MVVAVGGNGGDGCPVRPDPSCMEMHHSSWRGQDPLLLHGFSPQILSYCCWLVVVVVVGGRGGGVIDLEGGNYISSAPVLSVISIIERKVCNSCSRVVIYASLHNVMLYMSEALKTNKPVKMMDTFH